MQAGDVVVPSITLKVQVSVLCYLLYSLSASPDSISNPLNYSSDLSKFRTSANIMALIAAVRTASVVYRDGFLERSITAVWWRASCNTKS